MGLTRLAPTVTLKKQVKRWPTTTSRAATPTRASSVRIKMGMFQVKVTVANPLAPERSFQDPFWVDTGALYSFAPEDRLHTIGIVPKFTRDFVFAAPSWGFADGKKDRRHNNHFEQTHVDSCYWLQHRGARTKNIAAKYAKQHANNNLLP